MRPLEGSFETDAAELRMPSRRAVWRWLVQEVEEEESMTAKLPKPCPFCKRVPRMEKDKDGSRWVAAFWHRGECPLIPLLISGWVSVDDWNRFCRAISAAARKGKRGVK